MAYLIVEAVDTLLQKNQGWGEPLMAHFKAYFVVRVVLHFAIHPT